MLKPSDEGDIDELSVSEVSYHALTAVALDVGDPVLEICTLFIDQMFVSKVEKENLVGLRAFTCILEGPSPARIQQLLFPAIHPQLEWLERPSIAVRVKTAEWIAAVAETQIITILHPANFTKVLDRILPRLDDVPEVFITRVLLRLTLP
jgi:hypothetical protein